MGRAEIPVGLRQQFGVQFCSVGKKGSRFIGLRQKTVFQELPEAGMLLAASGVVGKRCGSELQDPICVREQSIWKGTYRSHHNRGKLLQNEEIPHDRRKKDGFLPELFHLEITGASCFAHQVAVTSLSRTEAHASPGH